MTTETMTKPHQEGTHRAWKENFHDTVSLLRNLEGLVTYWCEEKDRHNTIEDFNDLNKNLVLYKLLSDLYEDAKEQVQKIFEAKEKLSRHTLPEAMERLEQHKTQVGNVEFNLKQRVGASIKDREEAMAWLREIGADGVIKQTVHSQTLSAIVKQMIQEKGEYPPDCIKVSPMNYVQIKKVK